VTCATDSNDWRRGDRGAAPTPKAVALVLLPALVLMLAFAFSYVGAFHEPTPHNVPLAVACIGLGVISLIALALVQSTLQAIFQAALYLYTKGVHENGFPAELMCDALRPKE